MTQQFYRVKTSGESRLMPEEELTQLPAVARQVLMMMTWGA